MTEFEKDLLMQRAEIERANAARIVLIVLFSRYVAFVVACCFITPWFAVFGASIGAGALAVAVMRVLYGRR